MTKSIAQIEAMIEAIKKHEQNNNISDLRMVYLTGMEEALMWVIGKNDSMEVEV